MISDAPGIEKKGLCVEKRPIKNSEKNNNLQEESMQVTFAFN